ncbi:MAG: hypothetical protein M3Y08_20950 [Fibrobacterota bacterium]|nr:hypothetical protein [Fibrobacterota bacterium]
MEMSLVVGISLAVFAALVFLAAETVREFKRMDKNPRDFSGSDRIAGSAE